MIITGADGSELEILISGYEFPDIKGKEHDLNWLRVHGRVKSARLCWEFRGPWLLTWEIISLAKWLKAVAEDGASVKKLRFTEPCLRCRLAGKSANRATVKVCFSHEAMPSRIEGNNVWIALEITDDELIRASASLLSELGRFPMRSTGQLSGPQPLS